jgi:hypothetical protein
VLRAKLAVLTFKNGIKREKNNSKNAEVENGKALPHGRGPVLGN